MLSRRALASLPSIAVLVTGGVGLAAAPDASGPLPSTATPDPAGVYSTRTPVPPPSADGKLRVDTPYFMSPSEPLFRQHCAMCHSERGGLQMGNGAVPSRSRLAAMTPEAVLAALSPGGAMQGQAAFMTAADRVSMAEFVTGKKIAKPGVPEVLSNVCKANPALPGEGPSWIGWSAGSDGARFQTAAAAGITVADIPRLKLKWAFAVPGGGALRSQPTVARGRLFIGGDTGRVYSIDAKTGCTYWSFKMDTPGRLAPIVAPITGHPGTSLAVFMVDGAGKAYALDAHDGKLVWSSRIGEDARVSAAASLYKDRLFVPLIGSETINGDDPNYECCKSRGGLAAFDTNTGKLLWRVSTIPEPLHRIGVNPNGKTLWGPSGASVWNTPTVDGKRGVVYVGTGNNYGPDPNDTSDAILAFRMADGKLLWSHQEFKGDAFMARCPPTSPGNGNCPAVLGGDSDFGGGSVILHSQRGRDLLLAAGKGGVAIALDPDQKGKLIWRTKLYTGAPPPSRGLVLFGGAADAHRVYYPLQRQGGGLTALAIEDGAQLWTAEVHADPRGQGSAPSAIPGAVFTGGWDGVLRAVDKDGRVIWSFDTHRDFEAVNGVPANGGSMGSSGPAIVGGMVYVASGYIGASDGYPGNVVLAFSAN